MTMQHCDGYFTFENENIAVSALSLLQGVNQQRSALIILTDLTMFDKSSKRKGKTSTINP